MSSTLNLIGDVARDATTQILAASAVSIASASLTNLKRRKPFIFTEDEDAHIEEQARQWDLQQTAEAAYRGGYAYELGLNGGWA